MDNIRRIYVLLNWRGAESPGGELPLTYDGGGGPKVELNPKPKKILNFGNFSTPKKIHAETFGTLKIYSAFHL